MGVALWPTLGIRSTASCVRNAHWRVTRSAREKIWSGARDAAGKPLGLLVHGLTDGEAESDHVTLGDSGIPSREADCAIATKWAANLDRLGHRRVPGHTLPRAPAHRRAGT